MHDDSPPGSISYRLAFVPTLTQNKRFGSFVFSKKCERNVKRQNKQSECILNFVWKKMFLLVFTDHHLSAHFMCCRKFVNQGPRQIDVLDEEGNIENSSLISEETKQIKYLDATIYLI